MKIQIPNWFRRREKQAQFSSFPAIPLQLFPEAARDRQPLDLQTVYKQSLDLWRSNLLARRIVGLTSQYVVGGGVRFHCDHEGTRAFLEKWWQHALNQGPLRVYEWCDEFNLFRRTVFPALQRCCRNELPAGCTGIPDCFH